MAVSESACRDMDELTGLLRRRKLSSVELVAALVADRHRRA
jgi:hypothetical protein